MYLAPAAKHAQSSGTGPIPYTLSSGSKYPSMRYLHKTIAMNLMYDWGVGCEARDEDKGEEEEKEEKQEGGVERGTGSGGG